jgi:hypothetical protein
MARVS